MLVQLLGNQQLNNLVEESICSSLEKKKTKQKTRQKPKLQDSDQTL